MRVRALHMIAVPLLLAGACQPPPPVAEVAYQTFSLPPHFEATLPAATSALLPEGTTRLLPVLVRFDRSIFITDLRPFESVVVGINAPPGVAITPLPLHDVLSRTDDGIVAQHVFRVVALDATPGSRITVTGTSVLQERFGDAAPWGQVQWSRELEVTTYQPTTAMLEQDRRAGLFYLKDALSRYDEFLRNGDQLPWDTAELEAYVDQAEAMDAASYVLLLRSKLRADEARRHLHAASKSTDPAISGPAKQGLADIEQDFAYWKQHGVPPPPRIQGQATWFGGDAIGMRSFHHVKLATSETFVVPNDWHGASRSWYTPVGFGFRWDARGGALGSSATRTTSVLNTLSIHAALLDWWLVEAQLPLATLIAPTGAVWQGEVLNPTFGMGFVLVDRDRWRLRFNLGMAADMGVERDISLLSLLAPDMPQWTNPRSHSIDANLALELNLSQYSFVFLLGGQSIAALPAGGGGRFEDPPFAVRYDLLGNIWVVPGTAVQLDFNGQVFTTGSTRRHIGAAGIGLHHNISEAFGFRVGVYSVYGTDASFSSLQVRTGLSWTSWGPVFGREET